MKVTLDDIKTAQKVIDSKVQKTQVGFSRSFSKMVSSNVFLKFENEQLTGSFKIRGAMNKMHSLTKEEREKGVIASSAGNHAQGVALAATKLEVESTIVMPETSPIVKVLATEGYGANVIQYGQLYDDAYEYAQKLKDDYGYTFVHPFNDEKIIAGQGTIGLELVEQIPDLSSVIIPVGGGGLISGIAVAIKALKPDCKIYGVVSENSKGMYQLFKGEIPEEYKSFPTIADGTAVREPNQEIYDQFISKHVDDIVTVSEEEIAEAIVLLLERAKTVVEGASAKSLAALLKMKNQWELGDYCCALLCGGNIDLNVISKIIEKGQIHKGRLARFTIKVSDQPGTLSRLTEIIAEKKANVIEVKHDRLLPGLALRETAINFLVETRNREQVDEIVEEIVEKLDAQVIE